tara:strand:- start:1895 stop:3655 length:1761 start_codon:yes stop_codon:yes gene_type:complete
MNLIQVQEHLKDMPMRAIMEYANGKNPQVPPYLALGELNRRKQMEQSAKTGTPPDGTVKDKLEKEITGQAADLMQAGAAKQAQSNQQLQQSLMGQPQPVPEGTPQPPQPEEPMPEMQQPQQMAAGGLTSLPTGSMFKFAGGGGVVAFADEGLVVDQAEQAARDAKAALRQYGLRQQQQDPQGFAAAQQSAAAAEAAVNDARRAAFGSDTGPAGAMGQSMGAPVRNAPQQAAARVQPTFSPDDQSAAETARLARQNAGPPMGIATGTTPDASMMPPPMPTGAGLPSLKMPTSPKFEAPNPNAYDEKLAAFKQANPGMAGSEFQKLLDKIAKQDEEDRGKFITQEKGRTRADFWKALIDAGEATRGQKGIGALFGGFGKSAGASQADADERANAQTKMRREQELGMAKMRAELESARRAEARGDFEAAFKHKQDAEKIGRDLQQTEFSNKMETAKLQETANYHGAHIGSLNRDPEVVKIARSLHKPGMAWEEALDRASHVLRGAQYETVGQRRDSDLSKRFGEATKMIDLQLSTVPPNSTAAKDLQEQRKRIMTQFMADQKMLTGKGGAQDVNTPSSGFGTFKAVNPT